MVKECFVFVVLSKWAFNQSWLFLGLHHSRNTSFLIICLLLFIHSSPSTSLMPSKNSSRSATDASMSGITESRVPAGQFQLIAPVQTLISHPINLLLPSRRIEESNVPSRCGKANAMESNFTIGERDVWNAPLLFDNYAAGQHCLSTVCAELRLCTRFVSILRQIWSFWM